MEVSAAEALRFVRSLPKAAKPRMPSYAVSAGRSIRLSQRHQPGRRADIGNAPRQGDRAAALCARKT